jgi:hypothetical protein
MSTEKHKLTTEERRRGQAKSVAMKRARTEEERQLLTESRREHIDVAIDRLAQAAEKAAGVIEELLEAESEAVRLRAAVALMEALDAVETRELAERLEHLEELAKRNGSH